jgi:hypothetical protein
MNDITPKTKFMMMGLPDSGKSTFVAALWQVVRSADIPEALKLGTLKGDYSYIIKLHKRWSEGKRLIRTEVGEEGIISIPLRSRAPKTTPEEEVEIILPDLSGESFNQQWEMRTMLTDYYEHLLEASGLLVFVHSQKFNPGDLLGLNIAELEEILAFNSDEHQNSAVEVESKEDMPVVATSDETKQENPNTSLVAPAPFAPQKVPPQTKVVDLLQQAFWLTPIGQIKKVVLIISAWDLVEKRVGSPAEWLSSAMPLLDQYLKSNGERFSYRVYGISAQGAEYNKSTRVTLTDQHDPSKRIKVVDKKIVNNNITAPLQWLMN